MRNKQIVIRAIDYLANEDRSIHDYVNQDNYHYLTSELNEVEIAGNVYLFPTDAEFNAILKRSKLVGDLRTKQVILISLHALRDSLDSSDDGVTERIIDEALGEIDELVKHFPPLCSNRGWDVYGPDEEDGHIRWIDKVFFGNTFDSDYVRKSLINHDGYDSAIVVK